MNDYQILHVALPPFRHLFDYLLPKDYSIEPQLGQRVKIPFGNKTRIGVIVAIDSESHCDYKKLKPVEEILDSVPIFTTTVLKLIQFISQYYHAPLGDIFLRSLPPWLRKDKPLKLTQKKQGTLNLIEKKNDQLNFIGKENDQETEERVTLIATENEQKLKASHLVANDVTLNEEQQQAGDDICHSLDQFQTFLLDGITGSGKTEVYLYVLEKVLKQNKQALILVPEIGLTPQMVQRIQHCFPVPIALLHSSISEKKRYHAWSMAKSGEAPIVIGTRSAIFTPLKSPGIFIIDEEHDHSFKQQDNFRYHARDLLIYRASLEKCPVILGSATPSLETLHNTMSERYKRLRLTKRAAKHSAPAEVQVLDIRHKKTEDGLSSQLIHEMKKNLENGGQTLLFLNRRGFAPVMMCFDCGHVAHCKNCDAHLVLHYYPKKLRCHHCDLSLEVMSKCPSCQQADLNPVGVGTERLENALLKHFPKEIIVRIDRDNMRKKDSLLQALERIKTGDAKILLGTQMIAKGHDFSNVTLVGILEFDQALYSTDFRSLERLGQLLTQVVGRAGRREIKGTAILQTCHPEHPLLKALLQQGYHYFAELLLSERKRANLPPFSHQTLIRCLSRNLKDGFHFLNYLKDNVQSNKTNLKILGPVSAPIERKQERFHTQLLLQSSDRILLQKSLKSLVKVAENYAYKSKVQWSVDVDPIDMF